jgi:hypothetical protein
MQGKKAFQFGLVEAKASLNWVSLATSFAVAVLAWAGAELIPQLSDESGLLGTVAGFAAQVIPMVIMYLRNNKDLKIEPKGEDDASS